MIQAKFLRYNILAAIIFIISCGGQGASAAILGTIMSSKGSVKVDNEANGVNVAAEPDMPLPDGAIVNTGMDSRVEIAFDKRKRNILVVSAETTVVMGKKSGLRSRIELVRGKVLAVLHDLKKRTFFEIKTPTAICNIKGSKVGIDYYGGITEVYALEGTVYMQGIDTSGGAMDVVIEVPKGKKAAALVGEDPFPPLEMTDEDIVEWNMFLDNKG